MNYYRNEDQYRYIYFNHMNFAMKTVLKQKGAELPKETLKLLGEIHNDFETQVPSNTNNNNGDDKTNNLFKIEIKSIRSVDSNSH